MDHSEAMVSGTSASCGHGVFRKHVSFLRLTIWLHELRALKDEEWDTQLSQYESCEGEKCFYCLFSMNEL
jgi:hypothetical protein